MDEPHGAFKDEQAKTRRELIQKRTATNARRRKAHHAACAAAGQPAPKEPKHESLTISVKDLGLAVAAPAATVFTHSRCAAAAMTVGAYPATRNDAHHPRYSCQQTTRTAKPPSRRTSGSRARWRLRDSSPGSP